LALYLAAAGVGKIGLIDYDRVDISNLQRQILHTTDDIGRLKVDSAFEKLSDLNPHVSLKIYKGKLSSDNAMDILSGYDVIADGSDNFPARYLANDACILLNKPLVYASVNRFEAQITVFRKNYGPCYRCLFPRPPEPDQVQSCAEAGILGVLPGFAGVLQATEVIKILTGLGRVLYGRMLLYDALEMKIDEIEISKNEECLVCGDNPGIKELIDYEAFCGISSVTTGEDLTEEKSSAKKQITPIELMALLQKEEEIILLDVRQSADRKLGYFENSLHIPLEEILSRKDEIGVNKNIVVFCNVGEGSEAALDLLKSAGYKNVRNLAGGIEAWLKDIGRYNLKFI